MFVIVQNVAIKFFVVLSGVLSLTLATHHVYHVQPDDKLCVQLPCPTLQHIIDHHYVYFMSNTTILFGKGEYNHIQGDLIVQNVTNFSLIGAPNTSDPTSPVSVIRCLPVHLIYFYNVTNLLIKDLKFQGCGSLMPKFSGPLYVSGAVRHYWASVYIQYCYNVEAVNVVIVNPVGYGISGLNVMGNSSLKDTTIIMGREDLLNILVLFTCSYAVHWMYGESVENDEEVFLCLSNITLRQCFHEYSVCSGSKQDLIEITLHLIQYRVHITITDSNFHKLTGNIIKYKVTSLVRSSIDIHKCSFIGNKVSYIIDIQCHIPSVLLTGNPRLYITLRDIDFIKNSYFILHKFPGYMLQCNAELSPNSSLKVINIICDRICEKVPFPHI